MPIEPVGAKQALAEQKLVRPMRASPLRFVWTQRSASENRQAGVTTRTLDAVTDTDRQKRPNVKARGRTVFTKRVPSCSLAEHGARKLDGEWCYVSPQPGGSAPAYPFPLARPVGQLG